MSMNEEPRVVANGLVVTMEYSLTVDGELIDSSEDGGPIQFLQGEGNIVPGLESAIYGLSIGQNKSVVVAPGEGYGEEDPEAIAEIPRGEFPPQIPLEPGVELQLRNDDGEVLDAFIEAVDDEMVQLNFNHPLAGKDLHFDVTIVALRHATPEEIEHGHVHEEGHTHED